MQKYVLRSAYRKLKFLGEDLDDRKVIFSDYEKDFMRVVRIARGNIKVQQDKKRLQKNIEDAAEYTEQKKADEALAEKEFEDNQPDVPQKKLYRKIAMESHPDRHDHMSVPEEEREDLHDVFKRASEAYEADDIPEMLRLALQLDIDIQDLGLSEDEILTYVSKAIQKIQTEVKSMSESFVWMWGTSLGDVEMRVRLLDAYLRQTGHPPISNTLLRDIVTHHEDPKTPEDGSSRRSKRKTGTRPKKLIR